MIDTTAQVMQDKTQAFVSSLSVEQRSQLSELLQAAMDASSQTQGYAMFQQEMSEYTNTMQTLSTILQMIGQMNKTMIDNIRA